MNKIGFILLSALALPFTAAADSSLRLGKHALVLLNDAGQPVSELPMRAKQLDVRPGLALVIDSGIAPELSMRLVDAVLPAIALSVLVHGVSATPLMALYRKRRVLQKRERRKLARRADTGAAR